LSFQKQEGVICRKNVDQQNTQNKRRFWEHHIVNDLEPYTYQRYLFEKIPTARTEADFRELLPNQIDKGAINAVGVSVVA